MEKNFLHHLLILFFFTSELVTRGFLSKVITTFVCLQPCKGEALTAQHSGADCTEDWSNPNSFQQRAVSERVCVSLSGLRGSQKESLNCSEISKGFPGQIPERGESVQAEERTGAKSVAECAAQWERKQGQGESVLMDSFMTA